MDFTSHVSFLLLFCIEYNTDWPGVLVLALLSMIQCDTSGLVCPARILKHLWSLLSRRYAKVFVSNHSVISDSTPFQGSAILSLHVIEDSERDNAGLFSEVKDFMSSPGSSL